MTALVVLLAVCCAAAGACLWASVVVWPVSAAWSLYLLLLAAFFVSVTISVSWQERRA